MDNLKILPERIKRWLNDRGLTDEILSKNKIGWNGTHIVIPIFNVDGTHAFNKYRRDPDSEEGPKYRYDTGSNSMLYGANEIEDAKEVIICEGEMDRLILQAKGFVAVSSTGGAGTFKPEWKYLLMAREVFMIFDYDKAGFDGRIRVAKIIPEAKSIPIPKEVGEHGDVTDFFVKLGKTPADFRRLMLVAAPLAIIKKEPSVSKPKKTKYTDGRDLQQAKQTSLDHFLKFDTAGYARCPFHNERTPSLKRHNDGKWWCYGCGIGGDCIDLVRRMNDLSLSEAIKMILSRTTIK